MPKPIHPYTTADSRTYTRSIVLVLTAGCLWSIAGLVVRLIDNATEWHILFYRSLALMATLLIYIVISSRGKWLKTFLDAGPASVLAGIFLGTAFSSWIFAMTHTTVANALFVLSAAPFMAAVIARIVLKERVKPVTWLCMSAAVVGISVMVGEGALIGTLSGNLLALGAAFGFACFSVILRAGRAVDMTPAVCWAGVWGTTLASGMLGLTQTNMGISQHDLLLCSLMGVVQVGLGLILFTIGSRHVPAGELNLLSLTEVMLGPVWVWIVVDETPGFYTLVGGAIVLGAIVAQALFGIFRERR